MIKSYLCFLILIAVLGLWQASSQARETDAVFGRYTVKSIALNFVEGKRSYKDKHLLGVLGFKEGEDIDATLADFGRDRLEEFYRVKGFAFVEVTLDEEKLPDGKVIYQVDEGPRVKINKVRLKDNVAIKTRALKKATKTSRKKWFLWARDYTEEIEAEDLSALKNIYWERGFLDVKVRRYVDPNIVEPAIIAQERKRDKCKVNITFIIDEGAIYIVDSIVLKFIDEEGATIEQMVLKSARPEDEQSRTDNKPFDEKQLRAQVRLEPREIYNGQKAKLDAKRLLNLYHEQGFVDAEAELLSPEFITDSNAVVLVFQIYEGERFRIGRIDITGNRETQDKVIRRILDEYEFQPGRWYNAEIAPKQGRGKLDKTIQGMTMAESVTITPLASEEPGQKNAEVHIKEGKTRWGMVGADISFERGLFGRLEFREENFNIHDTPKSFGEFISGGGFKGAGQKLRISLRPGLRESMYTVSFKEPYFRDKPESLDLLGSSWERENYKERYGFGEERIKGYIGLGQRRKDKWDRSFGFRVENVDVGDFSSAPPSELTDVEGKNFIAGVRFGVGKRTTDDIFRPSTGYEIETGYEQLAGDHTFGILSGTLVHYKTLHEDLAERKTILATKFLAGATVFDAPAFEKFYAGGTGTYGIRGFRYRGVSTRAGDNEDPIGSNWIFLAKSEVSVPLAGENLAGLFFIDSGAIDSGGYRIAIGSGLEVGIPLFGSVPIRVEFAVPIMKNDDDDTRVVSFSAGMLF